MSDKDYINITEWVNAGGGLLPVNDKAHDLMDQTRKGEVLTFKEMTQRDLKFHRCYMSLLSFIYGYLPRSFQKKVPEKNFYKWLKHLKGQYDVLFTFKDGTVLVEYDSISFGRMSQKSFENYVREQLPFIYTDVIGKFFEGEMYDSIIETIESEFEKFLAKL